MNENGEFDRAIRKEIKRLPRDVCMARAYIKSLCSFATKLVCRYEIILSVSLIASGAYAIFYYLQTRSLVDAILCIMAFWPAALSFYAIVKFPIPSRRRKSKSTILLPALVSFISYCISFFAICNVKYTFRSPEDFYGEVLFLARVILSSLALSFFLAGLTAKLSKVGSELYFLVSGLLGVSTGVIDTAAIIAFEPPPPSLGLFSSIFLGLILGALIFIITIVLIVKNYEL